MHRSNRAQAIRRRWPVVALTVLVATAAAILTSAAAPPSEPSQSYRASHTLYVADAGAVVAPGGIRLPTLALLASGGDIPAAVVDRLDLDVEPADLQASVRVDSDPELATLTVTATEADPVLAEAIADAYAAEIIAFANSRAEDARGAALTDTNAQIVEQEARIQELDATLATLEPDSAQAGLVRAERDGVIRQYGLTLERLTQLNDAAANEGELESLQNATAAQVLEEQFIEPPRSLRVRALIAGVIGLVLGASIALAMDRVDDKVRTRRDAQEAFGLPVVAEVPRIPASVRRRGMVVLVRPASYGAEAHRILRMALQLMPRWVLPQRVTAASGEEPGAVVHEAVSIEGPTKVVLVTSAEPGEGKTTTAANLAATFGELGKVVIALDCDFRHPTLHTPFGLDDGPGMNDVAHDGGAAALSDGLVATSLPNVMLLRGGTESAGVAGSRLGDRARPRRGRRGRGRQRTHPQRQRRARTRPAGRRRDRRRPQRPYHGRGGAAHDRAPRPGRGTHPRRRAHRCASGPVERAAIRPVLPGPSGQERTEDGQERTEEGQEPERRPPSAWTVPQQTATTGD